MHTFILIAIALLGSAISVSALPSCTGSSCRSDRSILKSCKDLTLTFSDSQDPPAVQDPSLKDPAPEAPKLKVPILNAICQNHNKKWISTTIDLDQILANILGQFVWGKDHFSRSASDIQLDSQKAVLSAKLKTNERDEKGIEKAVPAKVKLSKRIRNDNGQLKFVPAADAQPAHT
ncbi:hypothetical protein BGZ70_001793 [Mortierella alpina]|uniref:Cyanovirin-N domain-containing protein n=1 Tax=Mortierella alpina TaxID=64518 RepID=A0A9P6IV80_MORAP|nr:hypothetical protein BGZ70_001793 [Mortierella alpina]